MTAPDAVDQSGSRIDPAWAAAHGVKIVAGYIGLQDWKVVPPSYVRALHVRNIGFYGLYEDDVDNALKGAPQGVVDGQRARAAYERLNAGVGYRPPGAVAICTAVDFDTNPSQYPAIDAYLRAFNAQISGYSLRVYGEADLIDHVASIGFDGGFGTYAWSRGRVSKHADLQQYLNGQVLYGASVDFDRVLDPAGLGAWWPPGHALAGGGSLITIPTPTAEDDDMLPEFIRMDPKQGGNGAVIAHLGAGVLDPVPLSTWGTWTNLARPVTLLAPGPWHDYTGFLARGAAANVAAIAAAVQAADADPSFQDTKAGS